MKIKVSSIKGAFGQRLKQMTNDVLEELVKDIIKTNYNYESVFISIDKIETIETLKCLFNDCLTTNTSYWHKNYINYSCFYISNINISDKWPKIGFNETFNKKFIGKYKFITYEIDLNFYRDKSNHNGNMQCELIYRFVGDLNEALKYCPYEIKKDYIYKDTNNVKIQLLDELIYIKNNELRQGVVSEFKENQIIVDNNDRIYVNEDVKNKHIIVANNRNFFAGIKI